jgi:hypothetical protein
MARLNGEFPACRLHKEGEKGDYRAMNPPTEQLIRDYLNRVSVAARGRLSADDRRAFLARTRDFIEQNTRAIGRTQTADVLKLLSELGDPVSLVNAERQRLAAGGTESGAGPADTSLAARARRLRAAPANVASLLRASAAVVAPGDAPAVAEPSEDNPLTGDREEIVHARRPLSSRWRPGEIVIPRQPGPRPRGPGLPRRPRAGAPRAGRPIPPPAAPPDTTAEPVAPEAPVPTVPPEPVPQPRPEWPSVAARRPTAEPAAGTPAGPAAEPAAEPLVEPTEPGKRDRAAASDAAPGGQGPDWATLSVTEVGWTDPAEAGGNWTEPAAGSAGETSPVRPSPASSTNGTAAGPSRAPGAVPGDDLRDAAPARPEPGAAAAPGPGSVSTGASGADGPAASPGPSTVARNRLVGPPPAPGEQPGPQVPPRGARVMWAAGVRSRAMRMGSPRTAGARRGGGRPAGPPDGLDDQPAGTTGTEPDVEPRPGWEFLATAGAAAGRAAQVVVGFARRHPLEAVAVVLLGLGGLIYPPVWLMGALVAMLSKVWDIRDKWIGMGLPVFLVIVGIVIEVMLDHDHRDWTTYVRDAWVFAGHLSRILALLGAVFLAWRAERGPRNPTAPPWKRDLRHG